MNSILSSIKKLLGLPEEYDQFDPDIVMHINTVLAILVQMGVGKPLTIYDNTATWNQFISDMTNYEIVKSYVYFKVRLMFDPPQTSSLTDAINKNISELEWRLFVQADNDRLEGSDE